MSKQIVTLESGEQAWIEQVPGMRLEIVGAVEVVDVPAEVSEVVWRNIKETLKTDTIKLDKSGKAFTIEVKKQDTKK